ncbi:MAG: alpha-E domain-containing protein [Hyphomicrobiales bacterium]|nr:alpha-E domain-containing protein [Hyphomicrobiales bacterium]
MLSRTADSLFWLSRYMERAENLARVLDVASRMSTLPTEYSGTMNEWESAVATAGCGSLFRQHREKATRESVVDFLVASPDNPNSILACIQTCRTNARAVRGAMTAEMWEVVNGAWLALQNVDFADISGPALARFLAMIMETSLRFDSVAYRTMLRTDPYWFQRLGTFVERADNSARLLDVKYHVLLPQSESVGGGLDYFQWTSLLRSVSALTSFQWVYRESVKPWLVADFLILRPEQPRSLIAVYGEITRFLERIADLYGRQGESQRLARAMLAQLQNTPIDRLFQQGLHEFLGGFINDNNRLGSAIASQYLQ